MSEDRHNNFDLIRLLAALQVLVMHGVEHLLPDARDSVRWLGLFPGVPIFFFVSGFLVSGSLERTPDLWTYLNKRVRRVYPGLIVCVLMSIGAVAAFQPLPWSSVHVWTWVIGQMTIAQFYNPPFLREFGVGVLNGSLWTIPVEVQFYLALPLVYWAARRWGMWVFWVILIIALLAHAAFLQWTHATRTLEAKLVQVTLLSWLGYFLFGVLAQRHWPHLRPWLAGRFLMILAAYVAVGVAAVLWQSPDILGNRLPAPLALGLFGTVLAGAYSRPAIANACLGGTDISYGLYLYHAPIMNVLIEATERGMLAVDGSVALGMLLVLSIGAGGLSRRYVEQPAIARGALTRSLR